MYESKIQHHMFFFLSESTCEVLTTLQIYPRFVGWITQLFKVLDLRQTVTYILTTYRITITNYEVIVEMITGS